MNYEIVGILFLIVSVIWFYTVLRLTAYISLMYPNSLKFRKTRRWAWRGISRPPPFIAYIQGKTFWKEILSPSPNLDKKYFFFIWEFRITTIIILVLGIYWTYF